MYTGLLYKYIHIHYRIRKTYPITLLFSVIGHMVVADVLPSHIPYSLCSASTKTGLSFLAAGVTQKFIHKESGPK